MVLLCSVSHFRKMEAAFCCTFLILLVCLSNKELRDSSLNCVETKESFGAKWLYSRTVPVGGLMHEGLLST